MNVGSRYCVHRLIGCWADSHIWYFAFLYNLMCFLNTWLDKGLASLWHALSDFNLSSLRDSHQRYNIGFVGFRNHRRILTRFWVYMKCSSHHLWKPASVGDSKTFTERLFTLLKILLDNLATVVMRSLVVLISFWLHCVGDLICTLN